MSNHRRTRQALRNLEERTLLENFSNSPKARDIPLVPTKRDNYLRVSREHERSGPPLLYPPPTPDNTRILGGDGRRLRRR
jgi:hypothetical protein